MPHQHNALHKVAYRGHGGVAEFLLGEGGHGLVELEAADADGQRPCDVAEMAGHSELAEWLRNEMAGHSERHPRDERARGESTGGPAS